jgi:CysZ protein
MDELQNTSERPVATREREPDRVVQRLLEMRDDGALTEFGAGFKTTLSSVKFLWRNKTLWPQVAIPAVINIFMFIAITALLLFNADWFMFFDEPSKGSWTYWGLIVLWWIYKVILYPLLLIVSYFLTLMLAGIVASPFNEVLSERAEHRMMGEVVPSEEGWKALVVGGAKGVAQAAATGIPRVILVGLLSLIPGVGPIIGAIVASYFIALEYTDYAFERRKYGFRQKLRTVWKHRRMAMGFGLGMDLLLIIPFVNFLAIPIAVVGGTAVAIALDEREAGEQESENDGGVTLD